MDEQPALWTQPMRDVAHQSFVIANVLEHLDGNDAIESPLGREMGVGRKIHLTEAGRKHPMYEGKATVFDGFVSHDDEVTKLPAAGATLLAGNDYSRVQAVSVTYNLIETTDVICPRSMNLAETHLSGCPRLN